MKTMTCIMAFAMSMTMFTISSNAQEPPERLMIHEDYVLISQQTKYDEASKGIVKALKDNAITDITFWAFRQDDNTYVYATPVENFAVLDKDMWKSLEDKVGKDKTDELFKQYDGTYQSHRTFMVNYHPELSYKADQLASGNSNYRVWTYFYFYPENYDAMMKISKEWKDLYESKNIPYGFTIYTNGFGAGGPVLIIHDWASSPEEYASHNTESNKILGTEAQDLWKRTQPLLYKSDQKTGWYLADLSYSSGQ